MTRVDQVIPTFAARDAIGSHTLQVRALLLSLGIPSTVYAEERHNPAEGVVPFPRLESEPAQPDRYFLYQCSTGSPIARYLLSRPERLVVNYHSVTPPSFFRPWDPVTAPRLAVARRQLRDLARSAELGVAVSRHNEAELVDAGFGATTVAPVLIDIEAMERECDRATEQRLAAEQARGGVTWLFVGRLAPNKAQHDVIKAFAVYRRLYDNRARLYLVGGTASSTYAGALGAFVGALGLDGVVTLTGSVPDGVLAALYRAADVFVCLSDHEGFCVPLLEAMHYDVPIVAFAASAVPETLADAGLLLDDKGPATVAAAVHRVIDDPGLADVLRTAGRARLVDFSLPRARARFTQVLSGLMR